MSESNENQPPATEAAHESAARIEVTVTGIHEKAHILVVDSEVAFLRLVEMALKRRGHDVSAVPGPKQAQEIVAAQPVDLMVSELHFPEGGGYGLLERLRADHATKRLPVIILTKDRKARSRVRALEIGADDVLHKPLLLDELFVRVESLIRKTRDLFKAAHSVKGDLAGKLGSLPVPELFPLLEKNRMTGLLRLGEGGQELACVWWKDGVAVAASFGPLQGDDAVYALFPLRTGNFEFRTGAQYEGEPNIENNVTTLLLEGMRRMDETVTFQLIGGRPLPGPRGAHIEWFEDVAAQVASAGNGHESVPHARPGPLAVKEMLGAFERRFRAAVTTGFEFSDLRELRKRFAQSPSLTLNVTRLALLCDLEDGLQMLTALLGPPSAKQLQRGLRSGVELFPSAQVELDAQHTLQLLVAPLKEVDVLAGALQALDAVYVAPPGGRWLPPELRDDVLHLLKRTKPFVCQPVGDGTVVQGLTGLLRDAGLETDVMPVAERMAATRIEFARVVHRLLRGIAPGEGGAA